MRNLLIRAGIAASGAVLVLVPGCAKKGSGSGSRLTRPGFQQSGTVLQNGNQNQVPPPPRDQQPTPPAGPMKMDPTATNILATCFNLTPEQVVPVVGWSDPTLAQNAATAYCALLNKVNYLQGILPTSAPVDVSVN